MDFIYLRAFFSLFLILGTFGNIFLFNSLLENYTKSINRKKEAIKKAYLIAYLIWLPIFFLGKNFLYFFGITEKSFAIAGSIFLSLIAFEIISKDIPSFTKISNNKEKLEEIIVTPMATPLLTGPGVITTTIIFRSIVKETILLFFIFTLSFIFSFLIVFLSIGILEKIDKKYFMVLNRIFGLILLAIAIEILFSTIKL
ncbi:MAG: MarC family protein [Nanopusillaceae archaeon]